MSDGKKGKFTFYVVLVACVALVCCGAGVAVLLPAIQSASEAARREQTAENLKQLAAALQDYHQSEIDLEPNELGNGGATEIKQNASPPKYIRCEAVLVDYDQKYPWFETFTENGREGHAHGEAPRALFVISNPGEFADRHVGVLFQSTGDTSLAVPSMSDKGATFSFEVPGDFLTGTHQTIGNDVVRNFSRSKP